MVYGSWPERRVVFSAASHFAVASRRQRIGERFDRAGQDLAGVNADLPGVNSAKDSGVHQRFQFQQCSVRAVLVLVRFFSTTEAL